MKKQTFSWLLTALAVVSSSTFVTVAAQSVTPQNANSSPLYFPNLDKNHDGFISRSEVPKELHDLRQHFNDYDGNQDHRLSVAEYSNYLTKLAAGNAGACNSSKQRLANSSCDTMRGMGTGAQFSPSIYAPPQAPPPPPPSGH